ncbi:MAG: ATP-binding protein [Cyanobacteria bacterium P01_A01_bin.17]
MSLETHLNLLIVDDDDIDRMAVRRALKNADFPFHITEACDCSTAAEALEQQTFHCMLLDYLLPDGNALSMIQTLRKEGQNLPIVVLTGQGDEQVAVEVMKAGASDYLAKAKVSPAQLSKIIQGAIRLYEAEIQVVQTNRLLRETNERLKVKTRQLEQQRQQIHSQNLQLMKASQLKSQFLATMSHEIRTPMNAIMGFSQILMQGNKGKLTDSQHSMAQRIFDNSSNLLGLLNKLLDFSKLESGRFEVVSTPVNVAKLVLATTEELRSLAEQKHLQLITKIQLEDKKIETDADRLRQILVNLVSNAIKFTESGHIEVQLSKETEDRVAIAIQDTGIGIASQHRDHIFEAFCQVDQTTTRQQAGTGLGLAITRSLVELLQGEIQVESTLGSGSTFRVILPRYLDLATDPDFKEAAVPAIPSSFI